MSGGPEDGDESAIDQRLLIGDPETLYEQAPCGYLSVHPDGHVLKANRTFLAWTGHEHDRLQGARFTDLLAPGARIFHETHYQPLLHLNGRVDELALDMLRSDGSRMPALVNAVMDRDRAGNPLVVRVAVFDATERRRYEQELRAAVERAEASEIRATRIARTLQASLLPPSNPTIPGLELATEFRPAGDGSEIGGDFYDVFELGSQDWVICIGDVAGKGVEAAVVANLARYTIRALSVTEESPAEVLAQLNQVVFNDASERFCTVAIVRLRRVDDTWHVTFSLGGHPSPILLDSSDEPRDLGEPSFLVGAVEASTYRDNRFRLRPGATVLLYTDGVTEARSGNDFYGEERLRQLLQHNVESPEALVGRILDDVLEFQDDLAKDDVALIAFRVPESR